MLLGTIREPFADNVRPWSEVLDLGRSFCNENPKAVFAISGPTASGKTSLSLALCDAVGGEVLISDSRQVFAGLPLLTTWPTPDEMSHTPHHGAGTQPPEAPINAYQYQQWAYEHISHLHARKTVPVLCGGTMLWSDGVVRGYDFNAEDDVQNPPHPYMILCPYWPRDVLYDRINRRTEMMVNEDLYAEIEIFMREHPNACRQLRTSLGVAEGIAWVNGTMTRKELVALLQQKTRKYAKRQLTWWRHRDDVTWVDMATFSVL